MSNEGVNVLIDILKGYGYLVKRNTKLVGNSGIKHKFDIVAEKEGAILLFNFTDERRASSEYLDMIGKYMDLRNIGAKFFLLVSTVNEFEIEGLCDEVNMITYANTGDLVDKVRKVIEDIKISQ